MEKNFLKNNINTKGITLVSLIITVVIMLILAGISISMLTGDKGLFDRTKKVVNEYELAKQNESTELQNLINSIDLYLNGTYENVLLEVVDKDATFFTLKVSILNLDAQISKYEIYVENTLIQTIETSEKIITYTIDEMERNTEYKCKVKVYTVNEECFESEEITLKTDIIATGDFVNYSVIVNDVEYNKWRILHKDLNGHMEIVCYNGPTFNLGNKENNEEGAKFDYANCIYLLNEASEPYKQGTFGYKARHLGSNPTNPLEYDIISEDYIYYGTEINEYTVQEHYLYDLNAVQKFNSEQKFYYIYTWLSARWINTTTSEENITDYEFRVRCIGNNGALSSKYLYIINSIGNKIIDGQHYALAPVVALESGVKINTNIGDGSENNPWGLTL